LRKHLDPAMEVKLEDVTEEYAVLGIMGPGSRSLLQDLTNADFSDAGFSFGSARTIQIRACELFAVRLSFVGELGWELYVPVAAAKRLLDEVLRAGANHELGLAGHFALDACRIEKGFHHWGHDIGADDTPFESGLAFAVNFDKAVEFIGKQALLEQKQNGWNKQLRLCEVAAEEVLILHDEPVYRGDVIVGHCTSGGQGFRTGKRLCFVMFYRSESADCADCQIEIAGERFALEVLAKPPYQAATK
jgi:4-methylaminobutanoate oxidase (formaldehyde-forming)